MIKNEKFITVWQLVIHLAQVMPFFSNLIFWVNKIANIFHLKIPILQLIFLFFLGNQIQFYDREGKKEREP